MNTNAVSLDRLHDIIVPGPVPWWPPAPGWYWVLGFVLVLILVLAVRGFIRWQHNRYRREALAELVRLEHLWTTASNRDSVVLALSELLKRTALTVFPREQVATLTGLEWFEFLDQTGRGTAFANGLGATLENAIYDPRNASALDKQKFEELTLTVHHWIKYHQTDPKQKDAKKTKDQSGDKPSLPLLPSVQDSSVEKPC